MHVRRVCCAVFCDGGHGADPRRDVLVVLFRALLGGLGFLQIVWFLDVSRGVFLERIIVAGIAVLFGAQSNKDGFRGDGNGGQRR